MNMPQTAEALIGIIALAKELVELSKDGVSTSDAVVLAKKLAVDANFRNKLISAVQGVDQVPSELIPFTMDKGIEIILVLVAELKK